MPPSLPPWQNYIPTMLEKIKKIRKWGVDGGFDFDIEARALLQHLL